MSISTKNEQLMLFFDVCSKIEGLTAELYHYYSELFLDNQDYSRLWKKTALEEENHQKQFELANKLRNDCDFELVADIEKAYRIFNKLTSLLSHVRQNPPDQLFAIEKAIEMEEALAELHLDCSILISDLHTRNMFKALQNDDMEHSKSLKNFMSILMLPRSEMNG